MEPSFGHPNAGLEQQMLPPSLGIRFPAPVMSILCNTVGLFLADSQARSGLSETILIVTRPPSSLNSQSHDAAADGTSGVQFPKPHVSSCKHIFLL